MTDGQAIDETKVLGSSEGSCHGNNKKLDRGADTCPHSVDRARRANLEMCPGTAASRLSRGDRGVRDDGGRTNTMDLSKTDAEAEPRGG